MISQQEKIIQVLQELEPYWDIAGGLRELIVRTKNEELSNLLEDIVLTSLQKTKCDLELEKKQTIIEKLRYLKNEEFEENGKDESFLLSQINTL